MIQLPIVPRLTTDYMVRIAAILRNCTLEAILCILLQEIEQHFNKLLTTVTNQIKKDREKKNQAQSAYIRSRHEDSD